jgi:DNA end-binding protein Ku
VQSIWRGTISFGLVSIPVRLYSATEEKSISFRQVHEADAGRIRYKRVCSVDGEEVPYSDIAKGYELPDGDMVVLTDEDFENLPLKSTRTVDVLQFVPVEDVDPVSFDRAYLCDPSGGDAKPYVLLRDALERTGKAAIVKVALRQRERLAMLRPRDGLLVLQTLLWPDEIRDVRFGFQDEDVRTRAQEVAMAESYIDALSGDLEPEEYVDEYRVALEEVIEAKAAGREVVEVPQEPEDTGTVVDLMEALRRSVAAAKEGRAGGEAASESVVETTTDVAEKAAAKKSAPAAKKSAASKKTAPAAKKSATASKAPGKKAPAKAPAKKTASKTASKTATKTASKTARKSA